MTVNYSILPGGYKINADNLSLTKIRITHFHIIT